MEKFLLSLAFTVIDHYLTKGGQAILNYGKKINQLQRAYDRASKLAKETDEVLNDDKASLEDKLRAIDDVGR